VLPVAAGPLGVGDRLRLRAGVARARRADRLGHRPPVTLRHPRVEARAPPASTVLRASEAIRAAARRQALASLPPERAGLLVGMALGDTSLLPRDLDGAFRLAGLSHLVAVSGANLAVVLGAPQTRRCFNEPFALQIVAGIRHFFVCELELLPYGVSLNENATIAMSCLEDFGHNPQAIRSAFH
jgi:hypothetical protein